MHERRGGKNATDGKGKGDKDKDKGGRTKTEQPNNGKRTQRNERKGTKENRIYRARETFVLIMRMSTGIRISQKEKINRKNCEMIVQSVYA